MEKLKPEDFRHCKAACGVGAERVHTRKGVSPYSCLDSWDKLEVAELPDKQAFMDMLTDSISISDADYVHAQRVWREHGCTSFQNYLDLYLKSDVCQLADVFEKFRLGCLRSTDSTRSIISPFHS